MSQVHSSRNALERARAGIAVFSLGMVAADDEHRRSMASARQDADSALDQRTRELRRARAGLEEAQAALRRAESERAAAESELAAARAAVPHDDRYASAARAHVSHAASRVSSAAAEERSAHHGVERARSNVSKGEESLQRCRRARELIHSAADRYRSSARAYAIASALTIANGRRTLGRLSSVLDRYLALTAYDTAASTGTAASALAGSGSAGPASSTSTPGWAARFGLELVSLRTIDPVPSDVCDATDRWIMERFENAVESVLRHEDWESRLEESDRRNGRTGERTLLTVVHRLCQEPIQLRSGDRFRVISGHALVAAAQRAGMQRIPARILEAESS